MSDRYATKHAAYRSTVASSLLRRYAREKRFRAYGVAAAMVGLVFLATFFATIVADAANAFRQTEVVLPVFVSAADVDPKGDGSTESLESGDYEIVIRDSLSRLFVDARSRADRHEVAGLVSAESSYVLRALVLDNPAVIGTRIELRVPSSAAIDMFMKGNVDPELDETRRIVSDRQITWVEQLSRLNRIYTRFNSALFLNGDSRDPELAGIGGAIMGSFYMLLVTVLFAFPVGVAAALYLEEFAPRNRWTDLIDVNINNLAAVPSIVYGLLGLALFINWMALPRSAPLVGGLVLALLTLPVVIIAARAAIQAVPPSIREAAFSLGASRVQMVFQHVVPLALPGILTGTIIGMARALGETAPLLMIGMVAFIVDIPNGPLDPATALPVQVYLWADSPEGAFVERTAAAIVVLLGFLLLMNLTAVLLRSKFERKWQ